MTPSNQPSDGWVTAGQPAAGRIAPGMLATTSTNRASKRILRDTRQAVLTIEGPQVALSAKLGSNTGSDVSEARKFAAEVNRLSQQLTHATRAPAATPAPHDDPVRTDP